MGINEEQARSFWQDQLTGELKKKDEEKLAAYLSSHPELARELEELAQTWALFEEIDRPEPSAEMDLRFEGMMSDHKGRTLASKPSVLDWIAQQMTRNWQVALASLVIGLLAGWLILPSQNQQQDVQQLSQEIQSMKEMMMLTLIEQPKAQERIRAVNLAAELPDADSKVIDALITTLNMDVNVNVRLASLESLMRYVDRPEVRSALVESLKMQESVLMFVAIADVLVQIQEKSSVEVMEQLKDATDDENVKTKLQQSIETLRTS